MASIWEKALSILAGNLSSGHSYLNTAVSEQDYFYVNEWKWIYSKALRYTALSCTDVADTRFWIGSQIIWDQRIFVVRTLRCTKFEMNESMKWKPLAARFSDHLAFTLLNNKSCTNFEQHGLFLPPKKVHLKALL